MSDLLIQALGQLSLPEAADILAGAARRLARASEQGHAITAEQALVVDSRARVWQAVPQWLTEDGRVRGVWIRAWSYRARVEAERQAILWAQQQGGPPDAVAAATDARQVLEEVRAGIVDPADLPIEVIQGWGHAVITELHRAIDALSDQPAAVIAAEIQRLAGGPPPPVSAEPAPSPRRGGFTKPAAKRPAPTSGAPAPPRPGAEPGPPGGEPEPAPGPAAASDPEPPA